MKTTLYGYINVSYSAEAEDIRIAIAEKTKQLFIRGDPTPDELAYLDMAEAVLLNPENRKIYDKEIKEKIDKAKRDSIVLKFDLGIALLPLPPFVASMAVVASLLINNHAIEFYLIIFAYFSIAFFSAICARYDRIQNSDDEIFERVDCKFCACIFLFWPVCYPYYFYYRSGGKYTKNFYSAVLVVILVALYLIHPVYDLLLKVEYLLVARH